MRFPDATSWVFDLDNTLYPASADLFGQMDPLMTQFIATTLAVSETRADSIRRDTWARYGATLTGLIAEYNIDPAAFLEATHQLDLTVLTPDPSLAQAIAALPGQRFIHTNGPRAHAARVLEARRLDGLFTQIVAIEDTGYVSKPDPRATAFFLDQTGFDPARAVMVEDQAANLIEPARHGMATIWITESEEPAPDHVTHKTRDLAGFLEGLS
ncbi:MAG: pyrimidine 5'-nucleotidase [Pseudomonadota bacterium]